MQRAGDQHSIEMGDFIMRYVNGIVALCVLFFFIPMAALGGDIDDPGGPTDLLSAMYTITDVYNRINNGTVGTKRTTTFGEPSAAPASTGHTLTELYALASERSRPAKTGQTTSYATGDDGNLQKGVAWPNPCFTAATDTVTDNLTGLIWSKNANLAGTTKTWSEALTYCNELSLGGYSDWRLPNVKELQSLINWQFDNPALSNDAGTGQWTTGSDSSFINVKSNEYWSSTTYANYTSNACFVNLGFGDTDDRDKGDGYYVWPVRGGQ
jgi:hypothetical protein